MRFPISPSQKPWSYLALFRRYCRFLWSWLTPPLFHPNFPLHQIAHVGVSPSRSLKLFGRKIIFEVGQPVWKTYLNVTDGQTTYCGITALCVASRGNEISLTGESNERYLLRSHEQSSVMYGREVANRYVTYSRLIRNVMRDYGLNIILSLLDTCGWISWIN